MDTDYDTEPHGVVLDVIDDTDPGGRESPGGSIILPRRIVLNGQHILVPKGTTLTVRAADDDVVVVTLTLMARRIRFGYADELDADLPINPPPGGLQANMETKQLPPDTRHRLGEPS